MPTLLADPPQNMIAQSQSGTGKTVAFVIAMLNRVDTSKNYPQIVCLSPTDESAAQTGYIAAKIVRSSKIKIHYAIHGRKSEYLILILILKFIVQNDLFRFIAYVIWIVDRGAKLDGHIIIGTPATVFDWFSKFKVFDIKKINVFVLDQADMMFAIQGHRDQCIRIHKYVLHIHSFVSFFFYLRIYY